MLHGELVKKAIDTFGIEIVEEVISQVDFKNEDILGVLEIYKELNQFDHVNCIMFLYSSKLSKPTIQVENDIQFVDL